MKSYFASTWVATFSTRLFTNVDPVMDTVQIRRRDRQLDSGQWRDLRDSTRNRWYDHRMQPVDSENGRIDKPGGTSNTQRV